MSIFVTTTRSVGETAGASKSNKKSLRLEKQTIRTLTGADLKLVGGGLSCCCGSCSCHSNQTNG